MSSITTLPAAASKESHPASITEALIAQTLEEANDDVLQHLFSLLRKRSLSPRYHSILQPFYEQETIDGQALKDSWKTRVAYANPTIKSPNDSLRVLVTFMLFEYMNTLRNGIHTARGIAQIYEIHHNAHTTMATLLEEATSNITVPLVIDDAEEVAAYHDASVPSSDYAIA